MGYDTTIKAIQTDIAGHGITTVPFVTVEKVTGQAHDDDEVFEKYVKEFVSQTNGWITDYTIDWINGKVIFVGPYTEPGGP
jgi:hypothetical protein